MPSIHTLAAFFLVSALLGVTPGPDNLFVLLQSAMRGPIAGMAVVAGLCTGLLVHTAAVSLGLAALFAASATAFLVVKWIGAAYLVYLGVQAFRAHAGSAQEGRHDDLSLSKMYVRGIAMNLTNPKIVIFFLAFLPQFADPARGSLAVQMLCLGVTFVLATLLVFGLIAYFSGAFGTLMSRSPRFQRILSRVSGVVFIALAVKLATYSR